MNLRIVVVALSLALSVSTVAPAFDFRTVSLTGQPAPETPAGVQFSDFIHAVINQSGDVAFNAVVAGPGVTPGGSGNSTGIWSTGGNNVRKVVRAGDQITGAPAGAVYTEQSRARIDDQGGVAFISQGVRRYDADLGELSLISAPPTGSALAYSGSGKLAGRGRDITGTRVDSIWTDASGSAVQALQTGDAAPGIPGYSITDLYPPVINDANVVVFTGIAEADPFQRRVGMWGLQQGLVSPLVLTGQQVPGFAAGTVFNAVSNSESSFIDVGPKINNLGQILFVASITGPAGNSTGLWLHDQGDMGLLAQRGTQAPGMAPGINFNSFDVTRINAAGAATFYGQVTGPNVTFENSGAIWTQRNGAFALVARQGDHPPGVADGLAFSSLQQVNPDLAVNANGQIAFRAIISGNDVTFENDGGIWATDLTGALRLIVREGELFDVNSDPQLTDFRTISEAALAIKGSGGEDGAYSSFNDAGELAVTLNFTDGSAGVFVFNTAVPEPSTCFLIGLATVSLATARSRLLRHPLQR